MYGLDLNAAISLQAIYEIYSIANSRGMTDLANRAAEELNKYYGEVPVK
jgi:hypothetical protein